MVERIRTKKMKRRGPLAIPYLVWLIALLIIPSFILVFLSFSTYDFSINSEITFTLKNWSYIFNSTYARNVFWPAICRSFIISSITTVICLLIGYPVAYFMSRINNPFIRSAILAFLVLPLWCNQVLRIVSWRTIFEMINLNYSEFYIINIVIAMVSMYLPFMILPIYTVLEKIDPKIIEASYDLGCNNKESFIKVILPLSFGGILSGIIMTFLPALTTFEVSDAISYNTVLLLGNLIYTRFQGSGGYNVGSVFSLITVLFTIIGFVIVFRVDKEGETLI